jgi:hypothetical protein
MVSVWPIENDHGRWLLRLGDEIVFLEGRTLPSGPTIASGGFHEPPRVQWEGIITHIVVVRADTEGVLRRQLVAVRNIVEVTRPES